MYARHDFISEIINTQSNHTPFTVGCSDIEVFLDHSMLHYIRLAELLEVLQITVLNWVKKHVRAFEIVREMICSLGQHEMFAVTHINMKLL